MICFGSSPTVGSSRIRTSGSPSRAWANPTRCLYPFERFFLISRPDTSAICILSPKYRWSCPFPISGIPSARCKCQIFPHRHILIERRHFRKIAIVPLGLLRIAQDIETVDQHFSFGRCDITCDDIHRRRFARAVRSEKAVNFSLFDRKAEIVDCYLRPYFFVRYLTMQSSSTPSPSVEK